MIANEPWEADAADKRYSPSVARNRELILDVLRRVLPASGLVLEIASGTGEHAVHFASALPALTWQPSDPDTDSRRSIAAWREEAGLPNLRAPLAIDVSEPDWPVDRADAVVCINMIHISPWSATLGLVEGASRRLDTGAPLYLYGPFRRAGIATAPSNEAFDASLKSRDPAWGLRDLEEVAGTARDLGFELHDVVEMPANNLSIIFRRS